MYVSRVQQGRFRSTPTGVSSLIAHFWQRTRSRRLDRVVALSLQTMSFHYSPRYIIICDLAGISRALPSCFNRRRVKHATFENVLFAYPGGESPARHQEPTRFTSRSDGTSIHVSLARLCSSKQPARFPFRADQSCTYGRRPQKSWNISYQPQS